MILDGKSCNFLALSGVGIGEFQADAADGAAATWVRQKIRPPVGGLIKLDGRLGYSAAGGSSLT
jgi:hypothetical protein